jgi:hypothetical protein
MVSTKSFGHKQIGPEHLLVGLRCRKNSLAERVLPENELALSNVRRYLRGEDADKYSSGIFYGRHNKSLRRISQAQSYAARSQLLNDNSKIDAVFARATDFEIVTAAHSAIEDCYGFETILQRNPRVPYDRWVVHTIMANTGLFEGNGYSYFWGSSVDHKGFAESLKVIGLPILSRIIEEAITQVPSSMLGDWDAVDDFFGGEEERIVAADTMDAKLIIENPGITDKASKYVRSHRYSYLDLLEAIDLDITKWRSMIEEYER